MSFLIGFLTVVLVLNCLLLILLVLVQLPKKDAGAGLAFGGGASDALFGAGAGNALTKLTKWVAVTFFGLSLLISILWTTHDTRGVSGLEQELTRQPTPSTAPAVQPQPTATPGIAPLDTNAPLRIPATTESEAGAPSETRQGDE